MHVGPSRRNVGPAAYREAMELPQLQAVPMETLFPELPAPGMRPVEVTVTVPDGDSRRCVMHVVAAEADAAQALAMAAGACGDVEDFEIVARRFRG